MRYIVIVLILGLFQQLNAQILNEVSLVVSSQGSTIDIAKQNALRSAVEQAFGAFVSAKTEILNDELIKDEVVSISNGNVKEYEILNQLYLEEQKLYLVNIKAVVSLEKLASFVQSKGYNDVSFDGSNFAMNMKLQRLNESSELVALKNILVQGLELGSTFFDQELVVGQPAVSNIPGNYQIPLLVKTTLNSNWDQYYQYFQSSLIKIAMTKQEIDTYKSLGKKVAMLFLMERKVANNETKNPQSGAINTNQNTTYSYDTTLTFRNPQSLAVLSSFYIKLNTEMFNSFQINHDFDTVKVSFQYGSGYMLKTGKGPIKKDISWEFNSSVDTFLPFECTDYFTKNSRQIYTPKGYKDTVFWIKDYQDHNLGFSLLPILGYSKDIHGYRIDSTEWYSFKSYYQPFIDFATSRDHFNSLNSIAEILLGSDGPFQMHYFFRSMNPKDATSKMKMYFINNSSSFKGELKINLTFTEQQLEQIKGFKLQKIN
jgi:hypothetical protein